eukprot:CAMPEP_0172587524 /NCGR_PEP_ID=MMETSP1068-20121228/6553_1 /TAXON_ID=35684 /ORGANISM="Pseudopedinella elastica, Strain CCMP716" /LENGTH=435 /DNA_ID=CAMNT_0013382577 /DNA_START=84 /DNA_END=1391 /DNA_ORIENTATION=-
MSYVPIGGGESSHAHDHLPGHADKSPAHNHTHDHSHTNVKSGHDHSHGHSSREHSEEESDHDESTRKLYLSLWLCSAFMLVELAGGILGNSLAVITDALHMLTDAMAFALAIYAAYISKQKATPQFTFGFKRAEVISALLSTLLIWVLTAFLLVEAVSRILQYMAGEMKGVDGRLMFFIALLGIFFNLVLERVLGGHAHFHSHGGHEHGHGLVASHEPQITDKGCTMDHGHGHGHGHEHSNEHNHGHEHANGHSDCESLEAGGTKKYGSIENTENRPRNLNIDAAYLHVIGDLVQSIGVAIAGALIWWNPSWKLADPLCTILFGMIVMYTTLQTLWSNISVLLEGVPEGVDLAHLKASFLSLKDTGGSPLVTDVHDLHVWSMSSGSPLLTAHMHSRSPLETLPKAHEICAKNGILHATIQVTPAGMACSSGVCCE